MASRPVGSIDHQLRGFRVEPELDRVPHVAAIRCTIALVRLLVVPVLLCVACSPGSVSTGGTGGAGLGGAGGAGAGGGAGRGGAGQAGGPGGAGARDAGAGAAGSRADGPRADGPGAGGAPATDAPTRMDGAPPADAARPADAPLGPVLAYVGQDDQRIHVYALDLATGALTERGAGTQTGSFPSFLAIAPSRRFLYAVNESAGQVASLSLDAATGALALLGTVPDDGGPTHLTVDPSGRFVLTAQYGGGTARVFPIGADGRAGAAAQTLSPGANAHQVRVHPGGFAFVPCLGTDRVVQYRFDAQAGQLTPSGSVATAVGAGPRHLDFHPTRALVYLVNERSSTLGAYTMSAAGTLAEVATASTLPAGFSGANTGAEVVVHPGGRFVYTSNRGHDSIARFSIDAQTGAPTLLGTTPTTGAVPRSFAIDGAGRWLVVANQDGRSLVSFSIDAQTGALSAGRTTTTAARPYFVGLW